MAIFAVIALAKADPEEETAAAEPATSQTVDRYDKVDGDVREWW